MGAKAVRVSWMRMSFVPCWGSSEAPQRNLGKLLKVRAGGVIINGFLCLLEKKISINALSNQNN